MNRILLNQPIYCERLVFYLKKIIIIVLFIIGFSLYSKDGVRISDDSIRFRVIANSNSEEDIKIKKLVVDELSKDLFKSGDINSTRKNIISNLSNIENRIDKIFVNNNYDKTYNVVYGMNEFPRKEYNGVIYEEGLYESLVVEIGDASGNNYWCFLYPSLCLVNYKSEDEEYAYKSKLVELFNKLF